MSLRCGAVGEKGSPAKRKVGKQTADAPGRSALKSVVEAHLTATPAGEISWAPAPPEAQARREPSPRR